MLSLAIDPLSTLVAWGVSWLMEHVKPLKDALDWLAGNADEVAAHAATWSNVSAFTDQARQQYADRLSAEVADWFGLDAGTLREGERADFVVIDPERLDEEQARQRAVGAEQLQDRPVARGQLQPEHRPHALAPEQRPDALGAWSLRSHRHGRDVHDHQDP